MWDTAPSTVCMIIKLQSVYATDGHFITTFGTHHFKIFFNLLIYYPKISYQVLYDTNGFISYFITGGSYTQYRTRRTCRTACAAPRDGSRFLSLLLIVTNSYINFIKFSVLSYTSVLRLLAMRGLRTICVRRVALRAPEVSQSNLFWEFFPLYKYCKQRLTNNFSYAPEDIIFEIYSAKNPTVGS